MTYPMSDFPLNHTGAPFPSRPAGELTALNNRLSEVRDNLANRLGQLIRLVDTLGGARPPQPIDPAIDGSRNGASAPGLLHQAHMMLSSIETLTLQIDSELTRLEACI